MDLQLALFAFLQLTLSATNVSANGALLGWNGSSGIIGGSWNVEWGTSGFAIGSGTTISNLTTYISSIIWFVIFYVLRHLCSRKLWSKWIQ